MIRLLLVEDHEALRTSLAYLLEQQPDMTVIAEVATIEAARPHASSIDVALIDIDLPDGDGTMLIPLMREANPDAAAIILTGSRDLSEYASALEQGATAALHKAISIEEVIESIRLARAGEPIHTQDEIVRMLQFSRRQQVRTESRERLLSQLTPREYEILHALADGLGDREIADRLNVSVRTVQSHMLNLMDKLGVHSRLQALVVAVRQEIVEIDTE